MGGVEMAEPTGSKTAQAINYQYRTSTEIMTRRGGIFWGLVLLILGFAWLAASFGLVSLNANQVLPLLVIVAGLYLLTSKFLH